jgi:hypothetical protein
MDGGISSSRAYQWDAVADNTLADHHRLVARTHSRHLQGYPRSLFHLDSYECNNKSSPIYVQINIAY